MNTLYSRLNKMKDDSLTQKTIKGIFGLKLLAYRLLSLPESSRQKITP
ncbi:MAG: hypothetical protein ACE5KT_04065 [Methanosarcinales archaeon]